MQNDNNFIMAEKEQIDKKGQNDAVIKGTDSKHANIADFDLYDSEFMHPMPTLGNQQPKQNKNVHRVNQSKVLQRGEVEKCLNEIFNYYSKSYIQPAKDEANWTQAKEGKLKMQPFLLFAKDFRILRTIFSIERMVTIFKKHADYGKYLSFDNFYFLINSMSHETEAKTFFNLQSMLKDLDLQTIEELEKQEFYNYLQLGDPVKYRQNFTQLFGAFYCQQKPRIERKKYNYRKFSLPELRKKALPEHKERKKGQKDLFILKHDNQTQKNIFDQAKSIVVSWDTLRAKSVTNLGKPADIVQKKYLRPDPEEDPYLAEVRPESRTSPRSASLQRVDRARKQKQREQKREEKKRQQRSKDKKGSQEKSKQIRVGKIEAKIKEIEKLQQVKNAQILSRIDKKLQGRSNHRLVI